MKFTNTGTGTGTNEGFLLYTDSDDVNFYNQEASGYLRFYTDSTEILTIVPTGDVGVGTTNPNSNFEVGKSFATSAIRQLTTSSTLLSTDYIVIVRSDDGSKTVTLPTASSIKGRRYIIKGAGDANPISILTTSSEYIDDTTSDSFGAGSTTWREYISDGSKWWTIGRGP